jgi:hypothetical protein
MEHRVRLPRTAKRIGWKFIETMIGQFKARMLACDDKSRPLAKIGEGVGYRAQLDGFRTRPDN